MTFINDGILYQMVFWIEVLYTAVNIIHWGILPGLL